jgi:hypothetical protein
MNKTFQVDFFEKRSGVQSRQRRSGSSTINLNCATSDFAVQAWLKRTYPNSEIIINSIQWS